MGALVLDAILAISAREPGRAGASVGSLASVQASGSVEAGAVVGAVVEVLVAKQASPSSLAVALVRLVAAAVLASWIKLALVAILASPSGATSSGGKERK